MSSIEFLSHDEVCNLTGARTKAGQLTVLRRNGVRHIVKMNGWPCVTTSALIAEQQQVLEKVTWKSNRAG